MNKEVKLNSVQGGAFSTSQNRLTFVIPSGRVYNLSESYINLNTEISVVENETASGVGVYAMAVRFGGANTDGTFPNVFNTAMIKNASIRSNLQGKIEDIRRVDQISNILQTHNTSIHETQGKQLNSMTQNGTNFNVGRNGIFRDLNKLGTIKSIDKNIAPVRINLEDVFDFCHQATELDTSRTGDIHIDCELNIDKLGVVQRFTDAEWPGAFATSWANVDVNAAPGNEIVSTATFTNVNQIPLWVGQKIEITGTEAGGAAPVASKEVVIASVTWVDTGADVGKIKLTFEQDWAATQVGGSYTAITLNTEDIASASIVVNFAELVLKELAQPSSDFREIEYSTFTTEQDNGNGLNNFQKQYQVEAEADAVVIAFPFAANDTISMNADMTHYRLRLDNQDLTDRNVDWQSPLYWDRHNMALQQMGLRYKKTFPNNGTTSATQNYAGDIDHFQQTTIETPLEQKDREKLLQVNIQQDPTKTLGAITLFKHLPRVFRY